MRHNKRTDKSQKAIVSELKDYGYQVIVTNFGESFPDLLVGDLGYWQLVEIKEPDGSLSRGQLEFLATAQGPTVVATNVQEVLGPCITMQGRDAIAGWLVRNPTQQTLSVNKFKRLITEI